MVITWPDLSYSVLVNPKVDSVYFFDKSKEKIIPFSPVEIPKPVALFDSISNVFDKHAEDDYIDFYYERNIPRMLSREGPKAAVADVNKDNLDDVYIGGTKGFPGHLYLQNSKGAFTKSDQRIFYQFSEFEDGSSLFFDADNDGDPDLFVGASGNSKPEFNREMQFRLLINDGSGNFTLHSSAFPTGGINAGAAAAYDFDNDNDLDLFVGARGLSGDYGINPYQLCFYK